MGIPSESMLPSSYHELCTTEQLRQIFQHIGKVGICRGRTAYHNEVRTACLKLRFEPLKRLAHQALHAIPDHRFADFLAHRNADAKRLGTRWGPPIQHKTGGRSRPATLEHTSKVARGFETMTSTQ